MSLHQLSMDESFEHLSMSDKETPETAATDFEQGLERRTSSFDTSECETPEDTEEGESEGPEENVDDSEERSTAGEETEGEDTESGEMLEVPQEEEDVDTEDQTEDPAATAPKDFSPQVVTVFRRKRKGKTPYQKAQDQLRKSVFDSVIDRIDNLNIPNKEFIIEELKRDETDIINSDIILHTQCTKVFKNGKKCTIPKCYKNTCWAHMPKRDKRRIKKDMPFFTSVMMA